MKGVLRYVILCRLGLFLFGGFKILISILIKFFLLFFWGEGGGACARKLNISWESMKVLWVFFFEGGGVTTKLD